MLQNLSAGISSFAVLSQSDDNPNWKLLLGTFAGTIQIVGKNGITCEHLVRLGQPIRGVKFLPSGQVVYHTSEECVFFLRSIAFSRAFIVTAGERKGHGRIS